jgi:hypothetical protein
MVECKGEKQYYKSELEGGIIVANFNNKNTSHDG